MPESESVVYRCSCTDSRASHPLPSTAKMSSSVRRVSLAENMTTSPLKPKASIGSRHVQALLMTGGFLSCYAMRVCMSVAIVAMTDKASPQHLDWQESEQNLVLSSFFLGYVATQIPGGMVAQRWGVQRLFGLAVGLCAVVTVAIPKAVAFGGLPLLIACRVIAGLCQGVVPPILHTLLAKWVPLQERGIFTSTVYSGGWIGNVIALQSSGYLSSTSLGWPSCFYFWGFISLGWSAIWIFFGRESPSEHPKIARDEKLYIENSLGVVETNEPVSTPWKSILTSVPVWALLVAQCTQTWGFWLLLSKIPTYMNKVLGYDMVNNGLMSSLPYLCAWLMSFPISLTSDWAIRTGKVSLRTSRMVCNTFGLLAPAAALVSLSFVGKGQQLLAVGILIASVASNIAIYCGHHTNHMDLSTNFAGPLMGFTNAAANVCSLVAPLVHSVMVPNAESVKQWNSIFFLTAGFYVLGALAFLLFGSTKIQPWNDPLSGKKSRRNYGFPDIPTIPESLKNANGGEKIER